MKARKSLGQNFLMHAAIARRIADAASITDKDTVLEIGPGTGLLTEALLARAKRVIAVEADASLVSVLHERFAQEITAGKLTVVHGDIRAFDASSLAHYAIVANIPYYITGEILRQFLSASHKPTSMTLLVQKEVAERIARAKKESILSLSVKAYGVPKYLFTVPKGAFVPAPKVDSAVLRITDIASPFATAWEEERFFALIKAGFGQKRKQLMKNLASFGDKTALTGAFSAAEVPLAARAEDLSLAEWKNLLRTLI